MSLFEQNSLATVIEIVILLPYTKLSRNPFICNKNVFILFIVPLWLPSDHCADSWSLTSVEINSLFNIV
jgi:hypothetical protein